MWLLSGDKWQISISAQTMGTSIWHALRGCPRGVLETVLGHQHLA